MIVIYAAHHSLSPRFTSIGPLNAQFFKVYKKWPTVYPQNVKRPPNLSLESG